MFHWFGFGLGLILFMLFWVLVIGLILALVRGGRRWYRYYPPATHDPLDIAKERYAKGEITKEEFEQIKKDLK